MRVHPGLLTYEQSAFTSLSRETFSYLETQLDRNDADAMRHVMRHLYRPDYDRRSAAGQVAIRDTLRYMIHCADEELLDSVAYSAPDLPFDAPDDMRLLFVWWWEALFGDEVPEGDDICDAEVVNEHVSPGGLRRDEMGPEDEEVYAILGRFEIDPEIVLFPRSDGRPPGYGAPPPDKVRSYEAPPLPRRPTDGARFLSWRAQHRVIEAAKKVHAETGQWKVWVELERVVGEGYVTGSMEYRRTAWACVRFYEGKPIDAWPDLRKGWKEKDPQGGRRWGRRR